MSKNLKILWIFYCKLILPTFVFSLLVSFLTFSFDASNFGFAFMFILPLMHYFIYEIRFPDEYVFYGNFGFSRKFLWICTIAFGFLIKILSGIL